MKKLTTLSALFFTACLSSSALASTTVTIEKAQLVDQTSLTLSAQNYLTLNQVKVETINLPAILNVQEIAFKQAKQVLSSEDVALANNHIIAE